MTLSSWFALFRRCVGTKEDFLRRRAMKKVRLNSFKRPSFLSGFECSSFGKNLLRSFRVSTLPVFLCFQQSKQAFLAPSSQNGKRVCWTPSDSKISIVSRPFHQLCLDEKRLSPQGLLHSHSISETPASSRFYFRGRKVSKFFARMGWQRGKVACFGFPFPSGEKESRKTEGRGNTRPFCYPNANTLNSNIALPQNHRPYPIKINELSTVSRWSIR